MFRTLLILTLGLFSQAAFAQEAYYFGDDAYIAGDNVTLSGDAVDDAFVAGNSVVLSAPVHGSAHAAGRSVSIMGRVGQNLYAAGMNVNLSAQVNGDAQLFGDTVLINEAIMGDLRVGAQRVEINGPVGDSAVVAAQAITLTEAIAGDASFSTEGINFGENARIEGSLHIYADESHDIVVPSYVVPEDRIVRHAPEAFDDMDGDVGHRNSDGGVWGWIMGKLGSILMLTAVATLVAAIAPSFLLKLRERTLESPVRTIWFGALSLSALAGSMFVLALTGVGILLIPVSLALTGLLSIAGYVIGTYILGIALLSVSNRPLPETLGERALGAFFGAVAITLITMIPILGWIAALAISLAGVGALVIRWFAPGFYTEQR